MSNYPDGLSQRALDQALTSTNDDEGERDSLVAELKAISTRLQIAAARSSDPNFSNAFDDAQRQVEDAISMLEVVEEAEPDDGSDDAYDRWRDERDGR